MQSNSHQIKSSLDVCLSDSQELQTNTLIQPERNMTSPIPTISKLNNSTESCSQQNFQPRLPYTFGYLRLKKEDVAPNEEPEMKLST